MKEEENVANNNGSAGEAACGEDKKKHVCGGAGEGSAREGSAGENVKSEKNKYKENKHKYDENNGHESSNPVSSDGGDDANNLSDENGNWEKEMKELRTQLEEAKSRHEECFSMLQRVAAEFDNYKKRIQKEKEVFSKEITCDIVAAFIPVLDNLERALKATESECDIKSIREGIELVYNQFNEILKSLGVEQIKSVGEKFDPSLHDAVMHVKDEEYSENIVVEELRKGYIIEDKVIRHSMVKVAN